MRGRAGVHEPALLPLQPAHRPAVRVASPRPAARLAALPGLGSCRSPAHRFLDFAIKFTPQYGDSFLECLRLDILQHLQERATEVWRACMMEVVEDLGDAEVEAWPEVMAWVLDDHATAGSGPSAVPAPAAGAAPRRDPALQRVRRAIVHSVVAQLDMTELHRRCVNADPNYGAMWFHVKADAFDTARAVVTRALALLTEEIATLLPLYLRALLRDSARTHTGRSRPDTLRYLAIMLAASVGGDATNLQDLRHFTARHFATGFLSLSELQDRVFELSPDERRRVLFSSDQLIP